MSIIERPLFRAAERLGPLPGVLFSSMISAGIVSILGCAVFGAVFLLFQTMGRGSVDAVTVFNDTRVGAIAGVAIGAIIHLFIALAAIVKPQEPEERLQFVLGGVIAIAALAAFDFLAVDHIRGWVSQFGDLQ